MPEVHAGLPQAGWAGKRTPAPDPLRRWFVPIRGACPDPQWLTWPELGHACRSAGGWLGRKGDEAEDAAEDASNDLGAAARQAKDKLANAGQYVQDRWACVLPGRC